MCCENVSLKIFVAVPKGGFGGPAHRDPAMKNYHYQKQGLNTFNWDFTMLLQQLLVFSYFTLFIHASSPCSITCIAACICIHVSQLIPRLSHLDFTLFSLIFSLKQKLPIGTIINLIFLPFRNCKDSERISMFSVCFVYVVQKLYVY